MTNTKLVQLNSTEIQRMRVVVMITLDLLVEKYGKQNHCRKSDPLDELVLGLLAQNNSASNSHNAFQNLKKKYGNWDNVMKAPARDILPLISDNGKHQAKVMRVKRVLRSIARKKGILDLGLLKDMDAEEGFKYLITLKGVGHKLASRVLQNSMNKSILPIDFHVNRIAHRLGWVPQGASSEATQILLKTLTPKYLLVSLYQQLEKHGRLVCKSQKPKCTQCIIRKDCQYIKKNAK